MGKTRLAAARAGITLDAGALIALDGGDRRMIALLDRPIAQPLTFRVPSGVVGQAWRDGRIQVIGAVPAERRGRAGMCLWSVTQRPHPTPSRKTRS